MKTVVITGGTGFIGRKLIDEFLSQNINVFALVRSEHKDIPIDVKQIVWHSKADNVLFDECGEIDAFYHLAWAGVASKDKNNTAIQIDNILLSLDMLELAKYLESKKFVAIGTVAEYVLCDSIMDFNAKQTPNDMYGAAKTAAHYLLDVRARLLSQPFIWAILPSTYGEGRKDDNILTYTIHSLLHKKRPQYGNLEQMWDFYT